MQNRNIFATLRWISVGLIFFAAILTVIHLVIYSRVRSTFPTGMMVGGIPVGGLTQREVADRLILVYNTPIEIRYKEAVIQVKPNTIGFRLDLEAMLAAADMERLEEPFWSGFWDYLWNRRQAPRSVPLLSQLSEERLRAYLQDEIAARYDQPPQAAAPVPGGVTFIEGEAGTVLNIDRAIVLIRDAMRSPGSRSVNLSYSRISPPRPSFQNLQILLKQIIEVSKFDGILGLYMYDLQNFQEIHFAYQNQMLVPPEIAFTAASTIKIPIMVSVFKRTGTPMPQQIQQLIESMIERSENDPADRLMELVLDKTLGPLEVTKDMKSIGLSNTFLAGMFYPGAPLLTKIQTPANQRKDVNASPDPYNQTTPVEMGSLLRDIYQCAESGGGTFNAVFGSSITQTECREMIRYLIRNKIAVLIQAGLPDGTQVAHKHGWIIETDGLMHTVSDAAIVYTPGGNYILSIYLYHPVQLLWDPTNELVSNLSRAVYNYFNTAIEK